jgi:phasin family protein
MLVCRCAIDTGSGGGVAVAHGQFAVVPRGMVARQARPASLSPQQGVDDKPSKASNTRSINEGATGMAKKAATKSTATKRTSRPRAEAKDAPKEKPAATFKMPSAEDFANLAKMPKAMTPEQAFDLYKTNAKIALDIINSAIENTAKLRKLQFAGEEEARSMQRKAIRHAAEASDPQSLVAAGQSVSQEAVEKAMQYWGEMFDMIVEMQKRLFSLMEDQMSGVPGAKEAKAALAMMPDLKQAQGLVKAMQGVMSSGGAAFESMQRVMGDFTRMAQKSMASGKP